MSEHDSGVDSEGETNPLYDPPMVMVGSNRDNEIQAVAVDEDMNEDDDDDDNRRPGVNSPPNDGLRIIADQNEQDTDGVDQEVVFLSESSSSGRYWEQNRNRTNRVVENDYNQPGTSRQCLSLNLANPRNVCDAIDSLFKRSVLVAATATTTESSSSCDDFGEPGPFRMRTVSVSEMKSNGTEESTATPTITNVSLNGFDFSINQTDPNALWDLYNQKHSNHYQQQQEQEQHSLVSKIRVINNRRQRNRRNPISSHKDRLLRWAVNQGRIQDVRDQITNGANVNATDGNLRTALHSAIVGGSNEIARLLLSNGADPNAKDMTGNTPLHLAVCSSKLDMVSTLLEHGANCISQDNNGRSPVQLARSKLSFLSCSIGSKTSADFKEKSNASVPAIRSTSYSLLDASLEEIKMEVMKISIMLGKCLERLHSERVRMAPLCNSNWNATKNNSQTDDDTANRSGLSTGPSSSDPIGQIESFRDRVQASQSTMEVEKDVNDLLKCLEHWAL